jgi:short subunit dehydrogenase-like uncharacterized protein
MAQEREYELILFGATGYTGKLVAEWVTKQLPQDLKWAVAGRNAKKLQGVVGELKELGPNRKLPGKLIVRRSFNRSLLPRSLLCMYIVL